MDRTGLINEIYKSETEINQGRIWLDTKGKEGNGRIIYHNGLARAMESFQQVQSLIMIDLELAILAEYTFVAQELQLCETTDTVTLSSLQNALQSFDDAFDTLKIVADSELYKGAEKTYPHNTKYRIKGMPRDAFHIMCISHIARMNNILRAPGINLTEKKLLTYRLENIKAAQNTYLQKQLLVFDEQ